MRVLNLRVRITHSVITGIRDMVHEYLIEHTDSALLTNDFESELLGKLIEVRNRSLDIFTVVRVIVAGIAEVQFDVARAEGRKREPLDFHGGPPRVDEDLRQLGYALRKFLMDNAQIASPRAT